MYICPLRLIGEGVSVDLESPSLDCLKHTCAWYVTRNGEGHCAMLVIAEALKLYLTEERERRDAYRNNKR